MIRQSESETEKWTMYPWSLHANQWCANPGISNPNPDPNPDTSNLNPCILEETRINKQETLWKLKGRAFHWPNLGSYRSTLMWIRAWIGALLHCSNLTCECHGVGSRVSYITSDYRNTFIALFWEIVSPTDSSNVRWLCTVDCVLLYRYWVFSLLCKEGRRVIRELWQWNIFIYGLSDLLSCVVSSPFII